MPSKNHEKSPIAYLDVLLKKKKPNGLTSFSDARTDMCNDQNNVMLLWRVVDRVNIRVLPTKLRDYDNNVIIRFVSRHPFRRVQVR